MIFFALFVFGSCIGSFLNVCIDRWPHGQSVIRPRSYCPYCQKIIPWYLNIPILSWIMLKGKSACCNTPIPIRYLISEVVIGIMAIVIRYGFQSLFLPYFILFCLFWIAFFTDISTMIIPDEVTLSGMLLGIILSAFFPQLHHTYDSMKSCIASLQGMCWGIGGLFVFIAVAEFFMKKEVMGLGDVKLMGCIGAFLGWENCVWSLLLGSVLGTIFAVAYIVFLKIFLHRPVLIRNQRIPFGPFLISAAAFSVL